MTRVTKAPRTRPGILYVILIELEGKALVKIGVTHRCIEDRVSEILVGIFKKYREFPYCKPKRFKVTNSIYEKEKTLHKHFSEYSYQPSKKFGGSTEFFDIPLDDVVDVYDKLLSSSESVKNTRKSKPKKKKVGVFFSANKNI